VGVKTAQDWQIGRSQRLQRNNVSRSG